MYLRALIIILALPLIIYGQKNKKNEGYQFKDKHIVQTTSVKNQYRSGTCWSFAATALIESELIRMGKGEYDLSEMYFVRNAYQQKAEDYVKYHGNNNFSEGGQAHDVMNMIRKHGFVPENVYSGLNYGENKHIHTEMVAMLSGMLKALVNNKSNQLTTAWKKSVVAILDIYLGTIPEKFTYLEKEYTITDFVKSTGFNPDKYIEFTSYTDASFYEKFVLKIPDNWSRDLYYNVTLDELIRIMDNALMNGYSICWDGDISEKGFSHKNGVAIIPEKEYSEMSEEEKDMLFKNVIKERNITQEIRQYTFENYTTTDDHLMHIIGIAYDQKGNKYYKTKNSWGTKSNDYKGFLYMSESYVKLKTVAFMVHEDAVPKEILEKLN